MLQILSKEERRQEKYGERGAKAKGKERKGEEGV